MTTPNGRVLHRKCNSKPLNDSNQDCNNNRGIRPRGPDGRFKKLPSKLRNTLHNGVRQRTRDTATRKKQVDNTEANRQRHGHKGYIRSRLTETDTGTVGFKLNPQYTGRDSQQHRTGYHNHRQYDRHGDRPCYQRR